MNIQNNPLGEISEQERKVLFGTIECDMLWSCYKDPRFCFFGFIPHEIQNAPAASVPLIVYIHGTNCNVGYPRFAYQQFAREHKCAILVPLFPAGVSRPDDINSYKLVIDGDVRYDDALLAMIEQFAMRFPCISIERFILAGHSGGGQFCQRFFYLHPERLRAVSIGAPGRPTYLDKAVDFYWGIRDFKERFGKEICLDALTKVPVQLAIGELDTKFISETPYGKNRMERLLCLKQNYEDYGISVRFSIAAGIGHNGDCDAYRDILVPFFISVLS